jgi:hypothetical protein
LSDSVANAWTSLTLSGGWVAFAGGFILPAYRKIGDEVQLRGLIKHATSTTVGTFATLPEGFRPTAGTDPYICHASAGACDIRVNTGGVLSIANYVAGGSGLSVGLAQVRFSVTP